MPELPEVETIKEQLKAHLIGQKVDRVDIERTSIFVTSPQIFGEKLKNRTIDNVARRAKFLVFSLGDISLITHLRMTGCYVFAKKSKKTKDQQENSTRFSLTFKSRDCLIYQDQRALGKIYLYNSDQKEQLFSRYGLEPFSADFKSNWLYNRLQKRNTTIKNFLLDQSELVGVGNIYASEILFYSKIHPLARTSALTKADARRLHKNIKSVLKLAIEHQGTTIDDYRTASGKKGSFQDFLSVYGKEQSACCKCGKLISRITTQGRSSYFCPLCQAIKN